MSGTSAAAAAGWHHRVRGFGGECTAVKIDALAAESGETIHNLPRPVTATDVAAAIRESDGRAVGIASRA